MFKLSKNWVLGLSGVFMLSSGALLMRKGLIYLNEVLAQLASSTPMVTSAPLVKWLLPRVNTAFGSVSRVNTVFIGLFIVAIILGTIKGQFVMGKVVKRSQAHVESHGGRVPFYAIFPMRSLWIIAVMMSLGMLLNRLPVPLDIRGFIDMTIGFALIRGGSLYFRAQILSRAPTR